MKTKADGRFDYYYLEVRSHKDEYSDIVFEYYSNSIDACIAEIRLFLEQYTDDYYHWEIVRYNFM